MGIGELWRLLMGEPESELTKRTKDIPRIVDADVPWERMGPGRVTILRPESEQGYQVERYRGKTFVTHGPVSAWAELTESEKFLENARYRSTLQAAGAGPFSFSAEMWRIAAESRARRSQWQSSR